MHRGQRRAEAPGLGQTDVQLEGRWLIHSSDAVPPLADVPTERSRGAVGPESGSGEGGEEREKAVAIGGAGWTKGGQRCGRQRQRIQRTAAAADLMRPRFLADLEVLI